MQGNHKLPGHKLFERALVLGGLGLRSDLTPYKLNKVQQIHGAAAALSR